MQVQDPPVNIVEMVSKKCEENEASDAGRSRNDTGPNEKRTGGSSVAARGNDQSTNEDEQCGRSDHHNSECGRSEENARHGGKNDANERERKTQLDTGVELEDDPYDKLAASGAARWGANTMQEVVQAAEDRLVYRQVGSVHAKKSNTQTLVRSN